MQALRRRPPLPPPPRLLLSCTLFIRPRVTLRNLCSPPRPPDTQKSIPESQQNPSTEPFKPIVIFGRSFKITAEPPLCIREPFAKFSMSQPDPSRKLENPVVSSDRGFEQPLRIPEHIPGFSESPPAPSGELSNPVVSSGQGFTPKTTGPVSTDQTVTAANLGQHSAEPVARSPPDVRSPPLDYLRPSPHKTSAESPLAESSRLSSANDVSPSATPKIVSPSSSAEFSDSEEEGKRTNVENLAVVRDRKVCINEDASLYQLCRSWLHNGLPKQDSHLPHGNNRITLPKPLPRDIAGPARPEEKENETENEEEESVEDLTTEDLLKQHIMRGKRVRARLREERKERISRYKHRLNLILEPNKVPDPDEK